MPKLILIYIPIAHHHQKAQNTNNMINIVQIHSKITILRVPPLPSSYVPPSVTTRLLGSGDTALQLYHRGTAKVLCLRGARNKATAWKP